MSALITLLSQGVTDLLNNSNFFIQTDLFTNSNSTTFTAQRVYAPNYEAYANSGLQVFVFGYGGRELDLKAGTRAGTFDTFTINVAVTNQIDRDAKGQPTQAQVDAMIDFVDGVIEVLRTNKIINDEMGNPLAAWHSIVNKPAYDPLQLDEDSRFYSGIEITFQDFSN